MAGEQEEGKDIKKRHKRVTESEYKHPINVGTTECVVQLVEFRISHMKGELEQVVNHETKDNQSANHHRSRCERRSLVTGDSVLLRLRQPVLLRSLHRGNV